MLGEGEAVTVGAPLIEGAAVQATLIETRKGEKIKIFKKIRRQGYRRTRGHRQLQSVLRVTAIAGAGQEAKWDGEVKLVTKAELDARARGLTYTAPLAANVAPVPAAEAAPKKPAARRAPAVKTAEEVLASEEVKQAMDAAETNAPVAEAPAEKPASPKAKAEPKAASAKAAAKAEPEAKKAAPKKAAAPKKDKGSAE
jgi:large subunit ribosomal protein L21